MGVKHLTKALLVVVGLTIGLTTALAAIPRKPVHADCMERLFNGNIRLYKCKVPKKPPKPKSIPLLLGAGY